MTCLPYSLYIYSLGVVLSHLDVAPCALCLDERLRLVDIGVAVACATGVKVLGLVTLGLQVHGRRFYP